MNRSARSRRPGLSCPKAVAVNKTAVKSDKNFFMIFILLLNKNNKTFDTQLIRLAIQLGVIKYSSVKCSWNKINSK